MRSTRHVFVAAALLVGPAVPGAGAGKAEAAAKAGAAVKAGQKALAAGQLPAGAAELKGKAVSALSTLPAAAAKALQGGNGDFTPERLQQIQGQAGQVMSALSADPRAAAAAAQAGVTAQKLDALKAQTAAVAAGFKGPDGKPSVEAAGRQAREFMGSEAVTDLKGQANQAAADLTANPQVNAAARQAGKEVRAAAGAVSAQTGLALPGKRPALTPHNAGALAERTAQAAAAQGGLSGAGSSIETAAQRALAKFCKKYEGKTAVPARCRKPPPEPAAD